MAEDTDKHETVLLEASLEALRPIPDGVYIDATYGRGGHSAALLEKIGDRGRVIAFDKDEEACAHAEKTLCKDRRFAIRHAPFTAMESLLTEEKMEKAVAGIIFDLGVSSPQLAAGRGFSFDDAAAFDMRMDVRSGVSAAQWINAADKNEIARVLKDFGEERNAKRISAAIVGSRPLQTARQLADLVASVSDYGGKRHPATRTFLALRLFLNNELQELSTALDFARRLLREGGRLAVISFHSLEDRIVKRFIRDHSQPHKAPRGLPVNDDWSRVSLRKVGRAVVPDAAEVARNPRARSARLRTAEKL